MMPMHLRGGHMSRLDAPVRRGRWLICFYDQDSKSQSANRLMVWWSNAGPSDRIPILLALTPLFDAEEDYQAAASSNPDNAMGGVPWLHLTGVSKANGARTAIVRLAVPAISMPRRLTARGTTLVALRF